MPGQQARNAEGKAYGSSGAPAGEAIVQAPVYASVRATNVFERQRQQEKNELHRNIAAQIRSGGRRPTVVAAYAPCRVPGNAAPA